MAVKRLQLWALISVCVAVIVLGLLGILFITSGRTASAALGPATLSGVPNVINYQGMLRQPDGTPVNGTYTMTFRLYKDPVAAAALYTETLQNVIVREGLFTVLLGDVDPIDTAHFKEPLYVGIQVENDAEMAPRQRLAPVPYAVQLTDGVYVDAAGNVGVGKTEPTAQLDVGGDLGVDGDLAVGGALGVVGKITSAATVPGDASSTVTTKSYVDAKWPDGPYCILRGGTYDSPAACPSGFASGAICLDTEDDSNGDSASGTTGSSRDGAHSKCGTGAGGMVRLELCCKD